MTIMEITKSSYYNHKIEELYPQEAWSGYQYGLYTTCVLGHFSRVRLCVTPWTIARQAPLSMGFSRQEFWNGLPCPPPGDLPNLGIEPMSLTSPALAGGFFTTSATWKAPLHHTEWQ